MNPSNVAFKTSKPSLAGSGRWATFIEATETSDESKRKQRMDEILKYNEKELAAIWAVFKWLKTKAH